MRPKKILIVEDETNLREVLRDKLEKEFIVVEAADGKEGLKKAIAEKPDLILLDIMMPVMDGYTMLTKLREHEKMNRNEEARPIPVTMLTNLNEEGRAAKAQDLGVFDYMVKTDWKLGGIVKHIKYKLKIDT